MPERDRDRGQMVGAKRHEASGDERENDNQRQPCLSRRQGGAGRTRHNRPRDVDQPRALRGRIGGGIKSDRPVGSSGHRLPWIETRSECVTAPWTETDVQVNHISTFGTPLLLTHDCSAFLRPSPVLLFTHNEAVRRRVMHPGDRVLMVGRHRGRRCSGYTVSVPLQPGSPQSRAALSGPNLGAHLDPPANSR
jgi:hypothetical protein